MSKIGIAMTVGSTWLLVPKLSTLKTKSTDTLELLLPSEESSCPPAPPGGRGPELLQHGVEAELERVALADELEREPRQEMHTARGVRTALVRARIEVQKDQHHRRSQDSLDAHPQEQEETPLRGGRGVTTGLRKLQK